MKVKQITSKERKQTEITVTEAQSFFKQQKKVEQVEVPFSFQSESTK